MNENKKACENCGKTHGLLSCAKCTRTICEDCYHLGSAGKLCGLCKDEEVTVETSEDE